MRWTNKPALMMGKHRVKTRFAFLPVRCGYESRWLEKVNTVQMVCPSRGNSFRWMDFEFVETKDIPEALKTFERHNVITI